MQKPKPIVCPGCTCLCDDIQWIPDAPAKNLVNACGLGQQWFNQTCPDSPGQTVDGKSTGFATAIAQAATRLSRSQAPLICGLDELTADAQPAAWQLADRLRASVDTSLTNTDRGSMFALQRIGKVTATLGEVANRSDLVVFWFCDPVLTHPRHLERYSQPQRGRSRQVIVVDQRETATAQQADVFIKLSREQAAAALCTIRGLVAGFNLCGESVFAATGIELKNWQELTSSFLAANYGSFFYGHVSPASQFDLSSDLLASLIRDLNQKTRFVCLAMRADHNALSAENVLAWSSGFPFAINLHRGHARFNWLEYSAANMLANRECDLILLFASSRTDQLISALDEAAGEHFRECPKIVIASSRCSAIQKPNILFQVSCPGINEAGDFCRQDDVMLSLSDVVGGQSATSARFVVAQLLEELNQS